MRLRSTVRLGVVMGRGLQEFDCLGGLMDCLLIVQGFKGLKKASFVE